MEEYGFYLRVFPSGNQYLSCFFMQKELEPLILIVDQLGHSANELLTYKGRILDSIAHDSDRQLVSYNTLYIYVSSNKCEIGQEDYTKKDFKSIPTEKLLQYIDNAVQAINLFEKGDVPGIVPASKSRDWIIVPREYVKDVFWELHPSKKV